MKHPARPEPESVPADETTGLPGLRSWGGVYGFVVVMFVVWVVLLELLTRTFS